MLKYIKKVKQPKSNGIRHWALTIIFAISTLPLLAEPVVVPMSLNPGDRYRLAFVTSGTRDATSTDINVYNLFVTNQANSSPRLLALNTTWRVIGSTASVNAITNIGFSLTTAIYNTAGDLVATGNPDLFDGILESPIRWDQSGNEPAFTIVWTGTDTSGGGLNPLGGFGPRLGQSNRRNFRWTSFINTDGSEEHPFYAISGELTVPSEVPEPGTLTMLGAGATLLWVLKRRRSATPDNRS